VSVSKKIDDLKVASVAVAGNERFFKKALAILGESAFNELLSDAKMQF